MDPTGERSQKITPRHRNGATESGWLESTVSPQAHPPRDAPGKHEKARPDDDGECLEGRLTVVAGCDGPVCAGVSELCWPCLDEVANLHRRICFFGGHGLQAQEEQDVQEFQILLMYRQISFVLGSISFFTLRLW